MTIPLRLYRGVALVEVQVNRKHSEWFLFDTGAQRTVMSDAAARRCGLRPHLMRLSVFKLGKGLVEARPVVVDDLRLPNGAFPQKICSPMSYLTQSLKATTQGYWEWMSSRRWVSSPSMPLTSGSTERPHPCVPMFAFLL